MCKHSFTEVNEKYRLLDQQYLPLLAVNDNLTFLTFLTRTKSRKLKSRGIVYNWRWNNSVVTWQCFIMKPSKKRGNRRFHNIVPIFFMITA